MNKLTSIYLPTIDSAYIIYIHNSTYLDPEWKGPLGKIDKLHIVGQKFRENPTPDAFNGAVTLVREPENEADSNAIRVEFEGQCVGYVRRNETWKVQQLWGSFDQTGEDQMKPKIVSSSDVYSLYLVDLQ